METSTQRPWRRALVYGLGLSGRAAARLLLGEGVEVIGVDSRPAEALDLGDLAGRAGLEVRAGDEPRLLPEGVEAVIVSPGVPPERPLLADARRRGLPVLAEVELAFRRLDGPVVGITGSNGKSTTTAMTGAMLAAAGHRVEVCGNIGEALSDKVAGDAGRTFVVELSSFQLEAIDRFRPQVAALLNLAPDHLDRYTGLADYLAAKQAIFRNQDGDDIAVLNADDPRVAETVTRARRRFFSRQGPVADGCYLDAERVVESRPGEAPRELFRRDDLPLPGVHNLENAMAAALLAVSLGSEPAALRRGLADFHGLPHRLERLGEAGGVTWFDDSKGTNPAAVLKSLEGFEDASVHLILGGRNKGASFDELVEMVTAKALRLYLVGEAADDLRRTFDGRVPWEHSGTLETAVAAAGETARSGEVVLLSPACASFDQFPSFAHRGRRFQELVRERLGEGVDG